jgi:hypothetical protein
LRPHGFSSLSPPELIMLFLIALVLFGPWGVFGPRGPFK